MKSKTPPFLWKGYALFLILLLACQGLTAQVGPGSGNNNDIIVDIYHVTSPGGTDGRIVVTIVNGDPPFEVICTDSNLEEMILTTNPNIPNVFNFNDLSADSYLLDVISNGGCVKTLTAQVLECDGSSNIQAAFDLAINGLAVQFTDLSYACGDIVEWEWDFGDNNRSAEQNPQHIYQQTGVYTIQLTATDSYGNTDTAEETIDLDNPGLTVQIDGPAFGDIGQPISFSSIVTGGNNTSCTGGYTYEWSFGHDASPSVSDEANPTVVYSNGGTKTVYLTVIDCEDTEATDIHTIVLEQTGMLVDFDWTPTNPNTNSYALFYSSVSGNVGPTSYQWAVTPNAGVDIVNDQNSFTNIRFANDGNYQVSLQVCDNVGCITVTKTITVGDGLIAEFSADRNDIQPGETVQFIDESLGSPLFWQWNFGDGSPLSTEQNPSHSYASSGCYAVSLRIWRGVAEDFEVKNCYIKVGNFALQGSISIHDNCNDGEPYLKATIGGGQQGYGGTYPAPNPCYNSNPNNNIIPYNYYAWSSSSPGVSFTTSTLPCTYITLDPNYPPYAQAIANGDPIDVNVKLIVEDFSFPTNVITINSIITIYQDLTILGPDNISACPGDEINLLPVPGVYGGHAPYQFTWDNTTHFLPGYDQNSPNPRITVPTLAQGPETYSVTVYNAGGNYTCFTTKTITINPSSLIADAGPPQIIACTGPSQTQLGNGNQTAQGGSGNYTYRWTPITGLSNPTIADPFVSAVDGDVTYTLMVTDNNGCMATDEIQVTASTSHPIADAGLDHVGPQDAICFEGIAEIGGNPTGGGNDIIGNLRYEWTSDNSQFPGSTEANPILDGSVNAVPGHYTYEVIVVDDYNGCFDTDVMELDVRPAWDYEGFDPGDNEFACAGQASGLAFRSAVNEITDNLPMGATPPYNYSWNPIDIIDPAGTQTVNPMMYPNTQYSSATLTVSDQNGCIRDFKSKTWLIYETVPDITLDLTTAPQNICTAANVCFDIEVDPRYTSWDEEAPPFQLQVEWHLFSSNPSNPGGHLTLALDIDRQVYVGTHCVTPMYVGENRFAIQAANICGSNNMEYAFQVTAPSQVQQTLSICDPPGGTVPEDIYEAMSISAASSCLANVVANDNTDFVGGESVLLLAGFQAHNSSDFIARISQCLMPIEEMAQGEEPNGKMPISKDPIPEPASVVNAPIQLEVLPNPFSGILRISYHLETAQEMAVTLRLLDVSGRVLSVLADQQIIKRGRYIHEIDGSVLPPGIYFVELISEQEKLVKRVVRIHQ